ncbi:MAG TPA: PP2C family protein-serine/threonine phosphatase [Mycobacteriales bacterium]|nr:PP2C family protein-serine/threonine phosphatase [Mycobacteriales bacterium]
MDTSARGNEALGRLLDTAEDAPPVQAVEAVTRELGRALGATSVSFLIADLSGRSLVRLAHLEPGGGADGAGRQEGEESATELPFDGGPAEQALRTQTVQVVPATAGGEWTVFAPVTERGEALGLLELTLAGEPGDGDVANVLRTAHALAFVLIANRRHTDMFEWGQRTTPFTLPAEIQRRLLPSAFTCEAGAFTLSAWLEPAAHVGGDTFDYSLGRDALVLSVTDAMGHGVSSALTATLCVGSLRNTRRRGAGLVEQAAAANAALFAHTDGLGIEAFATGVLGSLDLASGALSLLNAGHVAPYLARGDTVSAVALPDGLPLGLFEDARHEQSSLRLEPDDRLVFVTDGMIERQAAAVDLVAEIRQTRALHARETTRYLADAVLAATGGELADDATLLVLDWHGGHGGRGADRTTAGGADPARASSGTAAD